MNVYSTSIDLLYHRRIVLTAKFLELHKEK